jgi:hypothetical protein
MDQGHGFYRIAGLLLIVMAVWITIWLDQRLGINIMRKPPWMLLVGIIAILLVVIAAVLIYRLSGMNFSN